MQTPRTASAQDAQMHRCTVRKSNIGEAASWDWPFECDSENLSVFLVACYATLHLGASHSKSSEYPFSPSLYLGNAEEQKL